MSRNNDDRQPTSSQGRRQEPEQGWAPAPTASGSIPEASASDSISSSSSTSEPKSTLASRRLSARKALRPTSFSWSAPQSLMHPTAPSEHAPLAQREKYFRRINRPDLPFGPAPNRRQRGIALAAYVIATGAAGYMTLFADFGEDEHVFMPPRKIRRMVGLQPPVDAHTRPLRGRRGAPAPSSSSSPSASSSGSGSNVEQAGTNAAPIANSHVPVDGALGTSSPAPYAGIFSLRKTHSGPSPSPSAESGRADAKGQTSTTALDRTDALLKEREKELEEMLRRDKEGASGTKSWTDSLVPSSLTAWWGASGSGGRSATDDTKDASPQTRAKVV
ncbi:hypothetical protein IE81DRAFT_349891 [Ceraceosorus guamensis]|uniref:Uncharacterized protein n=1 Tax=Ceraceosorus guamensis TaxID=1522189 RepID=A0A316VU07_9BASI|nr:hypothetical protein IE81DRAFT_349891 [Ceraceosorus guamensis]PWN39731.1 hypothetical protein IE81DRAFT_349891 [Ceraceosorus guamensis]